MSYAEGTAVSVERSKAEIEIRENTSSYGRNNDKPWTRDFEIQAPLVYKKKETIA